MERGIILLLVCLGASSLMATPAPSVQTTASESEVTSTGSSEAITTSTVAPSRTTLHSAVTTESSESSTTTHSEPTSAALSLVEQCLASLHDWTPWTTKGENINSDGCGVRRRSRKFRKDASEHLIARCLSETETELSEYKEECKILSRSENVEVLQYYFVDEVFGNTQHNRGSGNNRESRKKRFVNFNVTEFSDPSLHGCPSDVTQRPVDFLIMLDKSGSMLRRHFRILLRSMKFLVEKGIPDVSRDTTRIAMMTFANYPTMEFDFDTCHDKECIFRQIYESRFEGGLTRMRSALEEARDVYQLPRGMRDCSRRVALMITDGSTSGEVGVEEAANRLKSDREVEMFVIGISDLINESQLKMIVSYPVLTHLYYMPDSRQARRVFKKITTAKAKDE